MPIRGRLAGRTAHDREAGGLARERAARGNQARVRRRLDLPGPDPGGGQRLEPSQVLARIALCASEGALAGAEVAVADDP